MHQSLADVVESYLRAEFFRASSETNRYILCSEAPRYPQSRIQLHDCQSGRRCGHPSRAGLPDPPPPRTLRWRTNLSAASFQSAGAQPDEGIGISRSHPTTAPDQVVGNSGGLALRAKPKQRDNTPSYLDDGGVVPLHIDQPSTIGTDSLAMCPSSIDGRSPQARKRTIMARYVLGDELKPSERWKRRLLIARPVR